MRRRLLFYWLHKTVWNILYLIKDASRTLIISHHASRRRFLKALGQRHTLLIRNDNDAWCTPTIDDIPVTQLQVVRLPGQHDDCWHNPEPYVRLLTEMAT